MLTEDTITDAQILALRRNAPDAATWNTADIALRSKDVAIRRAARKQCAEIINGTLAAPKIGWEA